MFYKASVFNLPGKLAPVEVGVENDDAVPEKLKDESEFEMFKVSPPGINEVGKLFEIKKLAKDESDDKLIDVHRQRLACFEFGVHEKIKPEDTDVPGTEEMFDDKK